MMTLSPWSDPASSRNMARNPLRALPGDYRTLSGADRAGERLKSAPATNPHPAPPPAASPATACPVRCCVRAPISLQTAPNLPCSQLSELQAVFTLF